jgi:hypothetical protein
VKAVVKRITFGKGSIWKKRGVPSGNLTVHSFCSSPDEMIGGPMWTIVEKKRLKSLGFLSNCL